MSQLQVRLFTGYFENSGPLLNFLESFNIRKSKCIARVGCTFSKCMVILLFTVFSILLHNRFKLLEAVLFVCLLTRKLTINTYILDLCYDMDEKKKYKNVKLFEVQ